MPDIIQLLPDSVSNQIAAGEVIQRPASVVKELVENSIDAGSTEINIIVKDGGRTLVQITDNGCGMSETDARMCFERHATSKIKQANDLFAIRTMGFRGEALASVSSVAEVELKTKRTEDELGTYIKISGYQVEKQEPVSCSNGTNIAVKNLFFNIPARRKFLKSDSTELKNILIEIQRVALSNMDIHITLHHNNNEIYNLPATNLKQRLIHVFGKNISQNLTTIESETPMAKISGYIGKPEFAKKKYGEQYFFVNCRFMKHPYLHRAVMSAYDKILQPDTIPSYFIFFTVPPESIDINIHPTKTEIKFEDEQALWQLLKAAVREALGKFNIIPSIDFETGDAIEIPGKMPEGKIDPPEVNFNPGYNPFHSDSQPSNTPNPFQRRNVDPNWEKLFEESGLHNTVESSVNHEDIEDDLFSKQENNMVRFFQFKNKYILTTVKSGLMVIDQKRAHERILYEKFLDILKQNLGIAQKSLFPEELELSQEDLNTLTQLHDDLSLLGFDMKMSDNKTIIVNGYPAELLETNPVETIESFLQKYKEDHADFKTKNKERIASSMARASAIQYGKSLTNKEMQEILDGLFACSNPNFTPYGKLITSIIKLEDIERSFK